MLPVIGYRAFYSQPAAFSPAVVKETKTNKNEQEKPAAKKKATPPKTKSQAATATATTPVHAPKKLARVVSSSDLNVNDVDNDNDVPTLTKEHSSVVSSSASIAMKHNNGILLSVPELTTAHLEKMAHQTAHQFVAVLSTIRNAVAAKMDVEVDTKIMDELALRLFTDSVKIHHEDVREYIKTTIRTHERDEDNVNTERRHQENLKVAQQEKDWVLKLVEARDRAHRNIEKNLFWTLIIRAGIELFSRGFYLINLGFFGVMNMAHHHLSDQCTSFSATETSNGVAQSYLMSTLGGVFNYVAVASNVSWISCYALYTVVYGVVFLGALALFSVTRTMPTSVANLVYCIAAMFFIGVTCAFDGIIAVIAAIMLWQVRSECDAFQKTFKETMPTAKDMNKGYATLDKVVDWGIFLPRVLCFVLFIAHAIWGYDTVASWTFHWSL